MILEGVWEHMMTTNSSNVDEVKSAVYYTDKDTKVSTLIVECDKDNIEQAFKKISMPKSCEHYLFNAKAVLKALSKYKLGATVEFYKSENNNIQTEAIEVIDYTGTYKDVGELPPSMSIIAIMTMYVNNVFYNTIADNNIHKVEILETFNKDERPHYLLRYLNKSEDSNLDVTFLYAVATYDDGCNFVTATYDLTSDSFIDLKGGAVAFNVSFDVKDDYEKLFKH